MSHEERTYWPSSATREELRAQGEIPYSFLVAQCTATIGAGTAAYLTAREIVNALNEYRASVASSSIDLLPFLSLFQKVIVIPTLGIATAVFCVGLLQTRFWFGTARLGFDLGRVAPKFTSLSPGYLVKRFIRQLVAILFLLGVTVGASAFFARNLFPLLNANRADVLPWLVRVAQGVAVAGGICMAVLIVFGFVASRLAFNLSHRLTKQEAEQESREFGG